MSEEKNTIKDETMKQAIEEIKKEVKEEVSKNQKEETLEIERKYADQLAEKDRIIEEMKNKKTKKASFKDVLNILHKSKGEIGTAQKLAKKTGKDSLVKAMTEESFTSGGAFVVNEFRGSELIELLRDASVMRSLNPRIVELGKSGVVDIPKVTGGTTAYFVGEQDNVTSSEVSTGTLTLTAKKIMGQVVASNELLEDASTNIANNIMMDLTDEISLLQDQTAIRSSGGANKYKGLLYLADSGNKFNSAGDSLTNILDDLFGAVTKLQENNIPMRRPGWILSPRTANALKQATDGTGGYFFKNEMDNGELLGMPFKVTNTVPTNLGGGSDESEIYLADFAEVIWAPKEEIELRLTPNGAYYNGSNVVSGLSNDSSVITGRVRMDFNVRRPEAVVVIEQVSYGA